MPKQNRIRTKYVGVFYVEGTRKTGAGKIVPDKIYYIQYRRGGKLIEEPAGRQFKDNMTAAKASSARSDRLAGKKPSNEERRDAEAAEKDAERGRWTVSRLLVEYARQKARLNDDDMKKLESAISEDKPISKTLPLPKALAVDLVRYRNYLKKPFGAKVPGEIIQLDVDRLRIRLGKELAPQTVKHVLALLRRIVNFGVRKQLCQPLLFKIETPRVNNTKTEDLTPEQMKSLLNAIEESEDTVAANMMRLALTTGMRRGEMFKLRWEDIDFHQGFITLRDPKGGEDQKIPMNESARAVFESIPQHPSGYVFTMNNGKPFVTDLRHRLNRIRDAAGLPRDFRALHGLRHTYASMLASSGQVDLYTIQKLMTHKSPLMTQRYSHLRDEALKRASNLAGQLIEQAKKPEESGKVVNFPGVE